LKVGRWNLLFGFLTAISSLYQLKVESGKLKVGRWDLEFDIWIFNSDQ
jgi:hypothetical protein